MKNKIKIYFLSMFLPLSLIPSTSVLAENYVMRFEMDGVKESGVLQEEVKKKNWEKFMDDNKSISEYTLDYTYNNLVFRGNIKTPYPNANFPNANPNSSLAIYHSNITNVDPFITVKTVGKSLVFNDNELYDIDGFKNISHVKGYLSIAENNLENLDGLRSLQEIGGDFNARTNNIKNIDGLVNLKKVNGYIFLYSNKLENVNGFINLKYVGGELNLGSNNIQNLKGISNLEYIGDGLSLERNPYLNDISGLSGLRYIKGNISLDTKINERKEFKGINSNAWICQPEQASKFRSDKAQQKDVCV